MFSYGYPEPLPTKLWDLSLGTGLGMKYGSGIRIGTTFPLDESIYFRGNLLFNDKAGLSIMYMHRKNYFTDAGTNNELSLGFSYLLDK